MRKPYFGKNAKIGFIYSLRIMMRFLRYFISKFLAGISLEVALFFALQTLLPGQVMEVKQWKIK